MNGTIRALGVLVLAMGLGACSSMNSVHWVFPGPGKPGESRVFSTDAFQRHLIMSQDAEGKMRVCSEASPDAMAVFSAAMTGRGILGPTERQLDAAVAYGQTAATIERTQTINMLREWMYRTCELWLSGAIETDEFLTRSARDHRSMVVILSVEQLTGVVKPPSTIISGPAVTAAAAQGQRTAELVEAYRKERAAAVTAEEAAASAFRTANIEHDDGNGAKPICTFDSAPAGKEAEYSACKDAERKAASTKAAADASRELEKTVVSQMGNLSAGLAAAVSVGTNNAGGLSDGEGRMSDTGLGIIAATVERIALRSGIDEALMFCVTYLREGRDLHTRATCDKVVADAAAADRMLLDPNNSALQALVRNPAAVRSGVDRGNAFNAFQRDLLARIDATRTGLPGRLQEFERLAGLPARSLSACTAQADCRRSVEGSVALRTAFDADPPASQDRLRQALIAFDN